MYFTCITDEPSFRFSVNILDISAEFYMTEHVKMHSNWGVSTIHDVPPTVNIIN